MRLILNGQADLKITEMVKVVAWNWMHGEELMRLLAVIFGIALIVLVALDAFETIVLPRRVTRRIRLTRLFYRVFQFGSTSLGRLIRSSARRDAFRGYMGPLSLLARLLFWAVLFVVGFGLIMWGLALPLTPLSSR